MSVILKTPSNGSVTVSPADTASDVVVTVPARTGNMAVDGPAFSAYLSASQNLSHATATKINIDTEEFDTNSNFASSRFTPTVAGYYQFSAAIAWAAAASGNGVIYLFKNGAAFKLGSSDPLDTTANLSVVSALAFANGTTDYFEIYGLQSSNTTLQAAAGADITYFQSFLARAA